eukprot:15341574-Ditylum_brightwellii.AAC.1
MQGGYKFLIPSSRKIINQREFTKLPMPDRVIKRLENLATSGVEDGNIIFTNRASTKIANIKNSDEYEDWPADVNLTGVDFQKAQDCQNMVNLYVNEDDNDNVHQEQEFKNENK